MTKHGNYYVYVVAEKFPKMAIMVACKKGVSIEDPTSNFFQNI